MTEKQYSDCDTYIRKIGEVLKTEMAKFDYALIDFKVEFGLNETGNVVLGDELSGGIWRLLDKNGKSVDPIACAKKICPDCY